ncbi:MAG: OsmC family protein [Rikenellaceae bacterium]
MDKITIKHLAGMDFRANINEHGQEIILDGTIKPLLLVALGGCTAMDCASLIRKKRVDVAEFEVKVEAKLSSERPYIYTTFRVIYCFRTHDIPTKQTLEKLHRIVEMSQERYCSVAAMLRKVAPVCYCILVNDQRLERCVCRSF